MSTVFLTIRTLPSPNRTWTPPVCRLRDARMPGFGPSVHGRLFSGSLKQPFVPAPVFIWSGADVLGGKYVEKNVAGPHHVNPRRSCREPWSTSDTRIVLLRPSM